MEEDGVVDLRGKLKTGRNYDHCNRQVTEHKLQRTASAYAEHMHGIYNSNHPTPLVFGLAIILFIHTQIFCSRMAHLILAPNLSC